MLTTPSLKSWNDSRGPIGAGLPVRGWRRLIVGRPRLGHPASHFEEVANVF
jgi:hypothetical protein